MPSMARQLRRRTGMPKKNASARTAPLADGQNSFIGWLRAVAPVVYTVSVAVCAAAPYIIGRVSEHGGLGSALCITSAAFLLAALNATALRLPKISGDSGQIGSDPVVC